MRLGWLMNNKFFGVLYVLNIVAQSIATLVTPAALLFFIGWLLVNKLSLPEWIYAIAIVLGIILGLCSMVKFILSATRNLERLESQRSSAVRNTNKNKSDVGNQNGQE